MPLEKGLVMNVDDMVMVSVDDHVIEPPDLFERHMPEKYKDQAPRLVRLEDGSQHCRFAGDPPGEYTCMRNHGGKGFAPPSRCRRPYAEAAAVH